MRIALDSPLPERIAVGAGNALLLRGSVTGRGAGGVRGVTLELGGEKVEAIGHGLRTARGEVRARQWWALLQLAGIERPSSATLIGTAATSRGAGVGATLGEVVLKPGLGPEYGSELQDARRRAKRIARDLRRRGAGPIVAIAIATHEPDKEGFERQLASIRAQVHEDWICLVSDDDSSEDSLAAIRGVIGDDPRVVLWPSSHRRGATGNFERALAMVPDNVDLVAPADQADYWYPQKLDALIGALGDRAWLAYGDMRVMRADGAVGAERWCDPARAGDGLGELLLSNFVPGNNSLFRRELLDAALPFPPRNGAGRYDHWLAACAAARGPLAFEPALLADHHRTGDGPAPAAGGWYLAGEGAGWRDVYFGEHARMLVAASVLRARCSDALSDGDRRSLEAILGADSRGVGSLRREALRHRLSRDPVARARGRLAGAIAKARSRDRAGDARDASPREGEAVAIEPAPSPSAAADGGGPVVRPLAVDVRDLHKTFRLPSENRPQTLREQMRHPLRRFSHGSLKVLDGISFQVERGELFGILGRNGSGKSTLLRILGGVYRHDSGSVRVSRRIAPVIELGVGFQPEFPALKNVILNAELIGLPEAEARRRFDSIIEFAGLEDFVDLKLRNYSSGMRSRLAFSIAIQMDADLLLLDEVLAVGDPAFQRKCERVLDERKQSGETTILLVTQQPSKVQAHCDRALLLEGGRIERIGDAADVARRYAEITLEGHGAALAGPQLRAAVEQARITEAWLEDEDGERVTSVRGGEPIRLRLSVEANELVEEPGLRFEIRNRANAKIFAPPTLDFSASHPGLEPGQRIEIEAGIENKLAPGPYTVNCSVTGVQADFERAVSAISTLQFIVVEGAAPTEGVVDLDHSFRVFPSEAPVGSGADREGA